MEKTKPKPEKPKGPEVYKPEEQKETPSVTVKKEPEEKPEGEAAIALEFDEELEALEGPNVQPKVVKTPEPKTVYLPTPPAEKKAEEKEIPAPPPPEPFKAEEEKPKKPSKILALFIWLFVLLILAMIILLAAEKVGMQLPFSL